MNIGRIWSNLTTRAVKYEDGNISTAKEADAVKAVQKLQEAANGVATEMLTLDNTPPDFNPKIVNNVYLDGSKSAYAGLCIKSNNGEGITRLDATGKGESYSISVAGDHKEIRHRKEINGKAGESPLTQEQWAIFDGSHVKYKAIEY